MQSKWQPRAAAESLQRCFGGGEFFGAAAVAVGADEGGGFRELVAVAEEAVARQVDVGEEERHRATLGDLLGFGQVLLGDSGFAADEVVERGGEQAEGDVVYLPCGAEAVDGGGDVRKVERRLRVRGIGSQDRPDQADAGECQVIQGDVEQLSRAIQNDVQRVPSPAFDLGKAI